MSVPRLRRALLLLTAVNVLLFPLFGHAKSSDQPAQSPAATQTKPADDHAQQQTDPLKRPLSDKERKKREEELKKELRSTYRKWLDQDVRWIITPEERDAFLNLSNDEERDKFIEAFWARRNPDPDSPENTYKEELYRRIAYANEHFSSGIPGYLTDRGHIYIAYGPPDERQTHAAGSTYDRPMTEGGGSTSTYAFEDWRYHYIDGIGENVEIEFVDQCGCGDYRMSMDPNDKDALLHTSGGGATLAEQMGMQTRAQRIMDGGIGSSGPGHNAFDTLEQYTALMRAPKIKFRDLEEAVSSTIHYDQLPFEMRADFLRVTGNTDLVPITVQIQNKDITFSTHDGVAAGTVNIFGRVTSIGGEVVQTFEDTVQQREPAELLPRIMQGASVYWKALPLRPGRYKLDLALKDVNGDRVGTMTKSLIVPEYDDDRLSSSSLILADEMEKVPTTLVGGAPFVIGTVKVRPRVAAADGTPAVFKKNQEVNLWMQVYNLGIDQQTKKANATIDYSVVNVATNKRFANETDSTAQMKNPGQQMTLEKRLPLASLEPGIYRVTITVKDEVNKQTIAPNVTFAVE